MPVTREHHKDLSLPWEPKLQSIEITTWSVSMDFDHLMKVEKNRFVEVSKFTHRLSRLRIRASNLRDLQPIFIFF